MGRYEMDSLKMTTRERIAKGIQDHDRAIEDARLDARTQVMQPFRDSADAYESAKGLAKQAGIIFSRLAQRREAVRNIGLLDYEQQKLQSEQERTTK